MKEQGFLVCFFTIDFTTSTASWLFALSVVCVCVCVCVQHPEFSFMLKEKVCPLVIKLFSPSLKYRQGLPPPPSPTPVEKPFFPIVLRLLRIVSILIRNYYALLVSPWHVCMLVFWVFDVYTHHC